MFIQNTCINVCNVLRYWIKGRHIYSSSYHNDNIVFVPGRQNKFTDHTSQNRPYKFRHTIIIDDNHSFITMNSFPKVEMKDNIYNDKTKNIKSITRRGTKL